ncbi:tripartite tricarboxylate transporter TctB family protein [Ruegeria sp. 2205SS24-7]|uniref:tripartite tricarboxylate transporter TctB family protein n=1 Tax=Ruegeria discodermiae TaxID=3064389 RepID=UPI0027424811|nr:tripartite tricarboxylate transporter TctB family protein [Ruegeria sp. 2205SS24-7]MDP5220637.1 tripartite tricarboxylate transporter TctB family protein [Ruegeria sp. 2205SS24-7]
MKKWFAAALLLLAIGYTAYGLSTLSLYTSSGRPAAGFFPLLIGVMLIVTCTINLWNDIRERRAEEQAGVSHTHQTDPVAEGTAEAMGIHTDALDGGPEYGRDVAITFAYLCGFVAILKLVGALPAMLIFMLIFLFTFNRPHPVSNVLYSLALPGGLYLLFKVLLNASLPTGPLGF